MSGVQKNTADCMACTASATINTKCQSEFGPEWTKVGDTGCGSCTFNGAVIGKKATCKHTSYLGNNLSCCLGKGPGGEQQITIPNIFDPAPFGGTPSTSTITIPSNLSCDPNWNFASGGCDAAMTSYCGMGTNSVTDPKCKEWRTTRAAQAKAVSINAIKANPDLLADSDTQAFARDLSNAKDSSLDAAVTTFCTKNPDNKLCTCVNSNASTKLGINPKCVDAKCLETGYLTANQSATACPNVISCTQINNLKTAGISLISTIETSQNCGNETPSASDVDAEEPVYKKTWFLIVLLITFVIFIAVSIMYAMPNLFSNNV